jgi:hypothetical protein
LLPGDGRAAPEYSGDHDVDHRLFRPGKGLPEHITSGNVRAVDGYVDNKADTGNCKPDAGNGPTESA